MKQNSDNYLNSPLFVDTEFVPSHMGYFTIFDPMVSKVPNVLPYSHDLVTSNELQEKVSKIAGIKSQASLCNQLILDMSIKDMKKKVCKKKIKGEEIMINSKSLNLINFEQLMKKEQSKRQGKERCDICCIMLANKTDVLHLSIDWRSQQKAKEDIVEQINYRYKIKVSIDDVQLNKLTFNFDLDEKEVTHIRFLPSQINNLTDFIFNSDSIAYVGVRILSNQFQIDREALDEQNGQSRQRWVKFQVNEKQFFKFEFEKIRQYKIKEILGIIGVEDAQGKGVRVVDKIYEPDEPVQSIDTQFKENAIINFLTADVVGSGETFWSMIDKNPLLQYGEIKKLANINSRQRFSFDCQENFSALSLFNSDFQLVQDKEQDNFPYLYRKIHKYIRNCFTHFTSLFDSSISSRFVGTLKEEISVLEKFEGSCYRRLGYELNCKAGDILTFNNFILTTTNKNLIQRDNPSLYPTKKTLIKIFSKTGREIKKYSSFGFDEVIFLPFTKFQVIEKGENQKTLFLNFQEIIEQPKKSSVSLILWVDDKKKQGIKMYEKLSLLQQSIYLYQIDSTSLLQKWIKGNRELITSKSVQIIVITNMRRFEQGMENQIAGIHTIRLALTQLSKSKIIVYIGNIQNTMEHLKNHQIPTDMVYVTNSGSELIKILKQSISSQETINTIAKDINKKKEQSVKGNDVKEEVIKKKIQLTLLKKVQKPTQPKPVSSILEGNQENFDEEIIELPIQSNLKKAKSGLLKYIY